MCNETYRDRSCPASVVSGGVFAWTRGWPRIRNAPPREVAEFLMLEAIGPNIPTPTSSDEAMRLDVVRMRFGVAHRSVTNHQDVSLEDRFAQYCKHPRLWC